MYALVGALFFIVLTLCSTPPHSNLFQPTPAIVRDFANSWLELVWVSLSRLGWDPENAFLNRSPLGLASAFCTLPTCRGYWGDICEEC
jgi:hypothetical protein